MTFSLLARKLLAIYLPNRLKPGIVAHQLKNAHTYARLQVHLRTDVHTHAHLPLGHARTLA